MKSTVRSEFYMYVWFRFITILRHNFVLRGGNTLCICGRLPVCFPVDKAGLRALFAMLLFLSAALTNSSAFFVSKLLFLLRSVNMISGSRVYSGRICEKQYYYCDWPLTSVRVALTFDLSGVCSRYGSLSFIDGAVFPCSTWRIIPVYAWRFLFTPWSVRTHFLF